MYPKEGDFMNETDTQNKVKLPFNKLAIASTVLAVVVLLVVLFEVYLYADIQNVIVNNSSAENAQEAVAKSLALAFGLVPMIALWIIIGCACAFLAVGGIVLGAFAVKRRAQRRGTALAISSLAVSCVGFVVLAICFILLIA